MSFTSIGGANRRTKAYSAVALPGCPFFVAAEYQMNIRPNADRAQGGEADPSDKNLLADPLRR